MPPEAMMPPEEPVKSQQDIIEDVIEKLEKSKQEDDIAIGELTQMEGTKTASPSPDVQVYLQDRIVDKSPEDVNIRNIPKMQFPKSL